jgi:hypothetical protein
MKVYSLLLLLGTLLGASEYRLGHGLEINQYLSIGGYFSSKYENSTNTKEYMLDDVAILAYGRLGEHFNYLIELEATEFWVRNFGNDTTQKNMHFHIERAWLNYKQSDYLSVKVGKFITPIGFWNLNPITVLKDTTSNPRYASEIYPKFTTGVMAYGYLPFGESITYSIFLQNTKDLDPNYNNIKTDEYYGVELKKGFEHLTVGFNMGEYEVDEVNEEHIQYFGASLKYQKNNIQLLGEYSHLTYNPLNNSNDKHNKYAYYLQGRYKVTPKHFVVGRYERFKDEFHGVDEEIKLIGYNYRPAYPVSIKCEYQLHDNKDNNKFLLSFSMLF